MASSQAGKWKNQHGAQAFGNPRGSYKGEDIDSAPETTEISEAELHLKELLKKQLDTKTTLEKELSKKRKDFAPSSLLFENEESRAGIKTLREFEKGKEEDSQLQKLRDYGLTDEEILLKLTTEGGQIPRLPKRARYGESSHSEQQKIQVIQEKIEAHEQLLKKEDEFSNTKKMSRLEMEIESSLHKGTEKAQKLSHLVKRREDHIPANDPVLLTLKEYEKRLQAKASEAHQEENNQENEDSGSFIGPLLAPLHVRIKPMNCRIVEGRKLDINQLRAIPRFENYEEGLPSKTLFIKNLAKNVSVEDLAALFVRFETTANPSMEYKVMKGKMRGQAFVTFPDESKAREALTFANGYILNGKPMVISFGRKNRVR